MAAATRADRGRRRIRRAEPRRVRPAHRSRTTTPRRLRLACTRLRGAGLAARGGARAALAHSTFAWTSTQARLERIDNGLCIAAPVIGASARAAWRRYASRAWLRIAASAWSDVPLLRIALHPADAVHADLLDAWRSLLIELLRQREPSSKSAAIDAFVRERPSPVSLGGTSASAVAPARESEARSAAGGR
jgi:predicted deacetylase